MATKGNKKATTSKTKKAAKPGASTKASTAKRTKKAATPTRKAAASPAKSTKRPSAQPKTAAARATVPRSTKKATKGKQMTPNPTKTPRKATKADAKKAPAAKAPAAKATGAKASATPAPAGASPSVDENATRVGASRTRAAGSGTKKSGARAAAAPVEESPAALRSRKRARQRLMQKFRRILLDKQASLLEAYHIAKGDSQTSTSDGTEDYIDYAVSSYAREFSLSLSEMERKNLRLVEEALARLDRKTFGDCQQCGNEIPIPRLDVEPWARHCIRCQELEDQGLLEERDSEWDDEEAVSSETEARLAGEGDEESDEEEREESN